MNLDHVINSWRDAEYRESLSSEERAMLPESPIGEIELTDAELADVGGGTDTDPVVCLVSVVITIALTTNNNCSVFGTCQFGTSACC